MKRIVFIVTFLGIALASCKKDESSPDSKKLGKHYFYIQNNLPENVTLNFTTTTRENPNLNNGNYINEFYKGVAFNGQKTLVRAYSYQETQERP